MKIKTFKVERWMNDYEDEAVYNLLGIKSDDINYLRSELEKYHIEVSGGNPFPRQMFHKPISVSVLLANIEKKDG